LVNQQAVSEIIYTQGEHWVEPLLLEGGVERSLEIRLEAGAKLHAAAFVLALGAVDKAVLSAGAPADARLSLVVDLAGEGAEFHFHSLYLAGGVGESAGRAAIDVRVNHLVPDCTSRQLIKGIAGGEATGSFAGMVLVARDAQRTDAQQRNHNLQLTDTAHVFATPALEIYADDVRCSHGSTVGRLDEQAVWYMRQRGVSEAEARRLQMHGFAGEIVARCPSEAQRKVIGERIYSLIDQL
jgi:Fe-S cluster assembly protein SufD